MCVNTKMTTTMLYIKCKYLENICLFYMAFQFGCIVLQRNKGVDMFLFLLLF